MYHMNVKSGLGRGLAHCLVHVVKQAFEGLKKKSYKCLLNDCYSFNKYATSANCMPELGIGVRDTKRNETQMQESVGMGMGESEVNTS